MIVFWRRLDVAGTERLEIQEEADGICVRSTVLCVEDGGYRIDYEWKLDSNWRTSRISINLRGVLTARCILVEREDSMWFIDGVHRAVLDGAEEPDLSVTPFCNSMPIRRLSASTGAELTLDTVYIRGHDFSVARSKQKYVRQSADCVRYVDLGTSAGFEANLRYDRDFLVSEYEGLFERVYPT